MHRSVVALLFSICVLPADALRVYSHVYKSKNKHTKQKSIVLQALKKLEDLWPGGHSKEMLSAGVPSHPSFDQSVLRQKLAKRMHARQPFVFAGFGSSVSAGHDNVYNQSWLFELERILKPTFQALNFDIEIRQRAMGGYGEAPFAAGCLSDRAGKGVDAVNWEWGMFHDPECEIAHFAKEASSLDGKPVLFSYLSTAVDFGNRNKQARSQMRNMFRNHDESWHMKYHPNEWFFSDDYVSKSEVSEYFNKVTHLKEQEPTKSVLARVQESSWPGIAKEHKIEAFYPVIPDASVEFMREDPWYHAREKAFNVNWHPGPMGHTLMASVLAHKMLTELKSEFEGASFVKIQGPGAGPTKDNPLVGTDAKAADSKCGNMQTQMCRSGVVPSSMPFSMWENTLRTSTSKDSWELQNGFLDNDKQIDRRQWWRGTVNSGEFQFELEVPDSGDQFAMVCGAPCGWNCRGLNGYVSSKGQRWWNKDMVKGMRTELQGQSDEQILAMAGFNGENSRKEVSDLQFTVNGKTIGNSQLVSMHEELFDQQKGSYCPGCKNAADVCQPVAKLAPGKHKIGMQVKPASYNHQGMHVDVLEVLLVG